MKRVVVIGAGPQGLAAAAHLLERGLTPLVLEAGPSPASAVAEWAHVRLFSPWPELTDAASRRLLEQSGWLEPTGAIPTGRQWIDNYLAPLADALGEHVHYGTRVVGVGRKSRDLTVDSGRAKQPFTIHFDRDGGGEERIEADAVIDASGTWGSPNPAGADGLPALGETAAAAAGVLVSAIPTIDDAAQLSGRHSVVIGSGHSAATAIGLFARAVERDPHTRVTWVLRRESVATAFGGGAADELPERGALGQRAKKAVDDGLVDLVTGFRTAEVELAGERAVLVAEDGRRIAKADKVFALTGFRPDLSFLSEVRLNLDPRLQAPPKVALEIDPNIHSCGSVRATGAADLAHPEPGFYIVGAKSYGRAPTFLALTGYEQVRSVVAELAGDREAAERVDLVLPDTGVCGGSGQFDAPTESLAAPTEVLDAPTEIESSCCTPGPRTIRLDSGRPR